MISRNSDNKHLHPQQGFSLAELMVVVAIILMISAVAVPNVIRGMRLLRLRSTATNAVGIVQQARQLAARDNRNYQVVLDVVPGSVIPALCVDLNADAACNRGEPLTPLATDVVVANAAPINDNKLEAALAPGVPLGQINLIISTDRATAPTFNARGLPCQAVLPAVPPNGITGCNQLVAPGGKQLAFGFYLQSTSQPVDGWAAVSVSPGGRIRRWAYDNIAQDWR